MDYGYGLTEWGMELWSYHQRQQGGDDNFLRSPFYQADTNLKRMDKFSASAFYYACSGLAYLEGAKIKLTKRHAPSGGQREGDLATKFKKAAFEKPFHKWRLSVFRNHYQPTFTAFEKALKDVIDNYGEEKAIELMPPVLKDLMACPHNLRENLQELQFKHTFFTFDDIDHLLQKIEKRAYKHKKDPRPKR